MLTIEQEKRFICTVCAINTNAIYINEFQMQCPMCVVKTNTDITDLLYIGVDYQGFVRSFRNGQLVG